MAAVIEDIIGSRFAVEIEGIVVASFKECSGLNAEIQVESYREGGLNDFEHKLPGVATYSNVTLKSGVASAMDFWKWFYKTTMGTVERKQVSVILYHHNRADGKQGEGIRWNLLNSFPVKWEGPTFNADDANVVMQSLELAHHGISLG